MDYLKNSDKVIGFYCFDDKDKDGLPFKLYCYVVKDRNGKTNFYFTDDKEEYSEAFFNYIKKNKDPNNESYNQSNKYNIFTDYPDKANINCKDAKEVFERMKRANKDEDLKEEEFMKAKDEYLEEEQEENKGIFARAKDKLSAISAAVTEKHPNVKKFAARAALVVGALLIGGGALKFALNKLSGPTATNSRVATTIDTNRKIDTPDVPKEEEKKEEEKEEQNEETATEEVVETTTYTPEAAATYYSSNTGYTAPATNTSTNSTSTNSASVTNSELPSFQSPASIDDSSDQNTNTDTSTPSEDNAYDNVIIEETPSTDDNSNDNNNQETTTPDEDFSEEIEVPAVSDDNENTDNTNTDGAVDDNTEDQNKEEDIEIGDVTLNPDIPEEAIDGDLSYEYEEGYVDAPDNIDEVIETEPLPDPNDTATGDYVTTEEEWGVIQDSFPSMQEETSVPVTEQTTDAPTQTIDVVPVEQDTTSSTTNEQVVDQVVEAMANGDDNVNIVYNTDGSLSVGYTDNTNTVDTSSMTK